VLAGLPCAAVPRVFSGIQPTGDMHLGNYLGAVRRWVDEQPPPSSPEAVEHHAIYCLVDLHALTVPHDPAGFAELTLQHATLLMAAGLDSERSLLFVQSHVAAHSQLTWLLNCVASMGELRRMTQFKEKSGAQEFVSVGLFAYPVLMAADILLYDTEHVPVGDDQRQHVELTRDIAIRFNQRFGDTFVVPRATFAAVGTRVMDLQEPTNKMSKSVDSPRGTVLVLDPPEVVDQKIKSAVTDSESEIRHDPQAKAGVSNLLELYAATTGSSVADAEAHFSGQGYGALKREVADAVNAALEPVRRRFTELSADRGEVERRLRVGARAAAEIAGPVLERAERAVGLVPRA
jgi:tryptophanyl-tRNA synthetase